MTPQSQVEERAGPADRRRLADPRGAPSCTGLRPHRRARRTPRRRATRRPGTPSSAAGRAATPRAAPPAGRRRGRTPSGTRNRTVPRRSPKRRSGSVSQGTLAAGIDRERPERAAPLGLDGEPERLRRRGQPGVDLGRLRLLVERVVQLAGGQPRRVVAEQAVAAEAGRVEARRPVRDRRSRSFRHRAARSSRGPPVLQRSGSTVARTSRIARSTDVEVVRRDRLDEVVGDAAQVRRGRVPEPRQAGLA